MSLYEDYYTEAKDIIDKVKAVLEEFEDIYAAYPRRLNEYDEGGRITLDMVISKLEEALRD